MATLTTAKGDSNAAKGDCNCRRNYPWNSWICSIAVLLLEGILEAMLLGSFCWTSNEEIPTLTLMVCSLCIKHDLHGLFSQESTYISYANLFVEFLHSHWTNHGWDGLHLKNIF
jgi:hypothetical protein